MALSMALAVIVPTDVLRLNSPGFERLYERFLGFLMRDSEKVRGVSGMTQWYLTLDAEHHKRSHMVHSRCHLGVVPVPTGYCGSIYPHVSLSRALCMAALTLSQFILGRHRCLHDRAALGSADAAPSTTHPGPATCTTQVSCRLHSRIFDRSRRRCWFLGPAWHVRRYRPNLDL